MLELTVFFETFFEEAAQRKEIKYQDIVERARSAKYTPTLITLEVGSRGIIDMNGFSRLKDELKIARRDLTQSLVELTRIYLAIYHGIV